VAEQLALQQPGGDGAAQFELDEGPLPAGDSGYVKGHEQMSSLPLRLLAKNEMHGWNRLGATDFRTPASKTRRQGSALPRRSSTPEVVLGADPPTPSQVETILTSLETCKFFNLEVLEHHQSRSSKAQGVLHGLRPTLGWRPVCRKSRLPPCRRHRPACRRIPGAPKAAARPFVSGR